MRAAYGLEAVRAGDGMTFSVIEPQAKKECDDSATDSLPFDVRCKCRTKRVPPQPHSYVKYVDPAFEKDVLKVSQAQRIPNILHHNHADDFRRRAKIAKRILQRAHPSRLASWPTDAHPLDSAAEILWMDRNGPNYTPG